MELTCRYTHADNRIGKLTVDNLPKGTARPIGNALRRALLSEIEGIAVTAVNIPGATHGFDTIDGVKEDVTALTANLRQLELRLYSCRKKLLTIDTQQRHVTALDIKGDADVEILNPQQPIATLNPGATLRMQIEVQKGRGFHQERDSSGLIPIPANFSPIKRVGYSVDAAEDGSESLVMEIATNGTISPMGATSQATEILIKSVEDSKVSGAFDENSGTFKLEPDVGNLLNATLKWALLSFQNGRDNRPVLDVVCSHSEIEIRTDGSIAPKVVLETSLAELREKFTSMKVALQNAQCEQESAKYEERELRKKPIQFGDVRSVEDMPDLLAFQRNSYKKFIEFDLPEVLSEIFPVVSDDGETCLEVLGHELNADAKTDATPLILSFRLNTDGGKKTEEFQVSVGDIPLMKADGTFTIQDVKRVGVSQLHRSPGANFGKTSKQTTARIIPYRGSWMEFEIHTNGTQVHVRMDRRKALPATAILRAYGVETNQEIIALFADMDEDEKELIQKTLQADTTSNKEEALLEIHRKMHPGETAEFDAATNRFEKMFGDPVRYDLSKIGRRRLNRKLELNVSEEERCLRLEDVVAVLKRLLQVHCGRMPVDDIASLTERRVRSIGELMRNQLMFGLSRMARHAKEKMSLQPEENLTPEDLVEPQFVRSAVRDFWDSSELSQVAQETNLLDTLTHTRRLSALGPGGLQRERTSFEMRDVHETHYGRICPIETPEGPSHGLISTLANHAQIDEYGFIQSSVGAESFPRTGISTQSIGVPTQSVGTREETSSVGLGERSAHILGLSASLIPLIEHDDTSRALMGANMQRQAVPLIFTEPPLVQSGMERKAAHDSRTMLRAHISSTVVSVTADKIVIKSHDGTREKYSLKKYERSNAGTTIDQKPIVSVGQSVQVGDSIADAQSIKDGVLSLGRNVLVAYMPWEGYNTEDGIVISDRLVKDDTFTSVHIEKIRVEARHTEAGIECLTPDLPGKTEGEINHLDEHGVAKIGTRIGPTDILVGKLSPRLTDESKLMNLLEDSPVQWANTSSIVPAYIEGEVIRTQFFSRKNGDQLPSYVEGVAIVEIAMRREVKVGDKFAGRHGNKGVISKIVPEADMPHLSDGTPVDVILNPIGVPTRLSYGQILETHLGWAAHQLGQPVISPPYNGPNSEQIKELLSRAGLPENGMTLLFDGRTGRPYDMEVTVGYQYLMKLNHLVDDKIHARSIGPYSIVTQEPLGGRNQMGGQRLGEMEVWALEAYGAAHNLYEMMTVKSNATTSIPFYRRLAHGDVPVLEGIDEDTPTFKLLTNCLRGLGIDLTKDDGGVHVRLASPEQIREWLQGEVGLEVPQRSHRTQQGDQTEEEIRESSLIELPNSHAMGQIELALPVSHVWFFKGLPSQTQIAPLLDLTFKQLESVLYFENYIVLDSATDSLKVGQVVAMEEYETLKAQHDFRAGIGGAAIRELLERIDLRSEEEKLVSAIQVTTDEKEKRKLERHLKLVRNFLQSGVRPEWMLLTILPVVPQAMRPTVPVSDAGRFATSDLNLLYRSVVLRNQRLKQFIDLEVPQTIIHHEARLLQQAVDALLDNGRYGRIVRDKGNSALQSLSDILRGKEGMFRSRLLGARMDYSGRSVIVPGPELQMHECGLPREIALKLFEPFLIHELMKSQQAVSIRGAKRIVDEKGPEAMAILERVIEDKVVLLNRAPTLHRGNLQAFKSVLIDEKAIRLHPLMCTAFNADFDGDQMAVHLPLTRAAQKEARELMLSHRNLMSPADGSLLARPELESVLGCYYLTLSSNADMRNITTPMTGDEVVRAYELNELSLHDKVTVNWKEKQIPTTVGRVIFNKVLAEVHPYVNETVDKTRLFEIVQSVYESDGEAQTVTLLEQFTNLGFRFATQMGGSISLSLLETDFDTADYIRRIEETVATKSPPPVTALNSIVSECETELLKSFKASTDGLNPLYLMYHSGARESLPECLRQATGILGLYPDVKKPHHPRFLGGNYRDGVSPDEHFIIARSGRKSLADVNVKIASCGYLSRRLVAAVSNVLVTEADCGTEKTRNPVNCETGHGICAKCYGIDLATGQPVQLGTSVGMIAALALGERASRLPLAGIEQLTELLEARTPDLPKIIAEGGIEALVEHLLEALKLVYLQQGIEIDSKHFEIVIRQMLSRVKIVEPGDTAFAKGHKIRRTRMAEENAKVETPATCESLLFGLTQVALSSDSFLSAAAFQQTTNVLAKAALSGALDPLRGLHESVIAGKRIPAGTGLSPS